MRLIQLRANGRIAHHPDNERSVLGHERKRYPQYEHTAVIVAEDITARFLNVISLFNGQIPLIALQMSAIRQGNSIGLVFTKVIDQLNLGLVEEDEETHEVTDRNSRENRGSQKTVAMADEMLELVQKLDPGLELEFQQSFYIGLARQGEPNNFAVFRPAKTFLRFEPRLERSDATPGTARGRWSGRDGLRRALGPISDSADARQSQEEPSGSGVGHCRRVQGGLIVARANQRSHQTTLCKMSQRRW